MKLFETNKKWQPCAQEGLSNGENEKGKLATLAASTQVPSILTCFQGCCPRTAAAVTCSFFSLSLLVLVHFSFSCSRCLCCASFSFLMHTFCTFGWQFVIVIAAWANVNYTGLWAYLKLYLLKHLM